MGRTNVINQQLIHKGEFSVPTVESLTRPLTGQKTKFDIE
jgi:hypothetical protein